MTPNSFGKPEKLCSLKLIQKLFDQGQSFVKYPLRVSFLITDHLPTAVSCQVMVNVSKKKFKRANRRNRIKRQMREAYRLNKQLLTLFLSENNISVAVAFNYIPTEELSCAEIAKGMTKALNHLKQLIESKDGQKEKEVK